MGSRVRLSWLEKYAILFECKSRGITRRKKAVQEVQKWAEKHLKLPKLPSYKTIMRILSDEDQIIAMVNSDSCHKKSKKGMQNPVLDEQLTSWIILMWERGIFLTDYVIREKAKRIQSALNLFSIPENKTEMKFTNGWLHRFKRRHNFKRYKSHGETGDADHAAAAAALPQLRRLASKYCLNDIFNADELGLYYTASPNSTIALAPLSGRKKSKERVTFLVCSNVDGTDTIPPLMIGKARRPRCFQGVNPKQLGIDYDYGPKAWMNSTIFHNWLCRFDEMISETPGRKALLFLDNAS